MKHNVRDEKGRFCKKAPVEAVTKGYKGFKKGLVCRGKQYKVGETYEENGKHICNEGMMHFCENPLDVLNFYPAIDTATGEPNEYAKVEAIGSFIKEDNKSATNKLRVVKKISLKKLIKDAATVSASKNLTTHNYFHTATTSDYSNVASAGYRSNATTTGYESHATTVNDRSHAITAGGDSHASTIGGYSNAATTGDASVAATTGIESRAATTGNYSHAVTSGSHSNAVTAGYTSHAAATGRYSNAVTTGCSSYATALGKGSIAAALGAASRAAAALGNWIVLAEYKAVGQIACVKAVQVDGDIIKPNIFYRLENGEFVEA